jgi:hypothetical protein
MVTTRNFYLALGLMEITSKYTAEIKNLKLRCVIILLIYCAQYIVCTRKYSITNMEKTLNFEVKYHKFKLYRIGTYYVLNS